MAKRFNAIATLLFRGDDTHYQGTIRKLQAQAQKDGEIIQKNLVRGMALGGGVAVAVKLFADFESGLRGVAKTTGLTGDELERFGEQIRIMAQDSVFGTDALLATSQAAAQLGITGTDNILAYTDAITKLAAASDFSPEEAAFALARLSEISNLDPSKVNNLAATFTALGNSVATTEAELNDSAVAVAAAGTSYGVTAADALGLAAAFASVGQASFANGTAVGNFFSNLGKATREGGDQLQAFADVMGVGTAEVIRLFREDAVTAFQLFTEGIGGFGKEADSYLDRAGILESKSQRLFKSVGSAIGGALETARKGFEEGTAHIEEYESMTDDLNNAFRKLLGSLELVGIAFGERLEPALRDGVDTTREFINLNRGGLVQTLGVLTRLGLGYVTLQVAMAGTRRVLAAFNIGIIKLLTHNRVVLGIRRMGQGFSELGRSATRAFGEFREAFRTGAAYMRMLDNQAKRTGKSVSMSEAFAHLKFGLRTGMHNSNGLTASLKILRGAAHLARGAFLLLGTAMKLAFGVVLLFLPETAKFLYNVLPDAIDYVRFKFRSWGNSIEIVFRKTAMKWLGFAELIMSGVDAIAKAFNGVFGTELPDNTSGFFRKLKVDSASAIASLEKDNKRLAILTERRFAEMAEDATTYFNDVKKSAAEMAGITLQTPTSSGLVIPSSGLGLAKGGAGPAKTPEQEAAEAEAAAARAAAEEAARLEREAQQRSFSQAQRRLNEFGRNAQEEVNLTRQRLEEEERLEREAAAAEHSRQMQRLNERGRLAEEENAKARAREASEKEHREMMRALEAETELEVYRMKLAGREEADIEHYERVREIEAEILEAKRAKDQEEVDRKLREMELLEKAHKDSERRKTMSTIAEGARAAKAGEMQHKLLYKTLSGIQKAEALYNLAVKGPSLAAEAFGRAQAAYPPPFGQVLGVAAAAAVMAQMAQAVADVNAAKYAMGGVVPGSGITDSHRALLTPGEVVTPVKNYPDVEDGIRTRMRREEGFGIGGDYSYDGDQRVAVDINLGEEASRLISVQSDAAEAQRL